MKSLLLSIHVVASILLVGPVAVTASLFPRYAPTTASGGTEGERSLAIARLLYRVTRVYGMLAVTVPVVGLALAIAQGRATEVWVVVAMVLTVVAGGLLVLQVTPRQREALDTPDDGARLRRLGMLTGLFNLLWVVVVVLMIVRPGSAYA